MGKIAAWFRKTRDYCKANPIFTYYMISSVICTIAAFIFVSYIWDDINVFVSILLAPVLGFALGLHLIVAISIVLFVIDRIIYAIRHPIDALLFLLQVFLLLTFVYVIVHSIFGGYSEE